MLLEVVDLRVEMVGSGADIVDAVSFSVGKGTVLGLVGESGSGKTTVSLALLGYARRGLRITAGRVVVKGTDLLGLPTPALRAVRGKTIAYIPQDPSAALNPALRIGAQLRDVLDTHLPHSSGAENAQRIEGLMGEVRLPSDATFLRRFPHQLSGGQQQRVAIAMAFACRPAVVVMDEPTTGLDVTTEAHVLKTLQELCREHDSAAVYVSHDLAVVAELATEVAVMHAGRVIEHGAAESIFVRTAHPYSRHLVRAIPDLSGRRRFQGILGAAPAPTSRPSGCSFRLRCELAEEVCCVGSPGVTVVGDRHVVRCFRAADVMADSSPIAEEAARLPEPQLSGAPLLRVSGLRAKFGDKEVLHGVSLDADGGECLAVVGESGSGKTTLVRCIVGLHLVAAGSMSLSGKALASGVKARDRATCREIQYVFQNPYNSLNPRRSVGALLRAPLDMYFRSDSQTARRAKIAEALTSVSLPSTAARLYPDELSGGERQRVAIARALLAEPRILICDEITSSLDVSVQASIVELLIDLQRAKGLTMLFVTHNLALVRSLAQRVVVLMDGEIAERGTVAEVLDAPKAEYTQRLIADAPSSDIAARFAMSARAPGSYPGQCRPSSAKGAK